LRFELVEEVLREWRQLLDVIETTLHEPIAGRRRHDQITAVAAHIDTGGDLVLRIAQLALRLKPDMDAAARGAHAHRRALPPIRNGLSPVDVFFLSHIEVEPIDPGRWTGWHADQGVWPLLPPRPNLPFVGASVLEPIARERPLVGGVTGEHRNSHAPRM